jgi:hypothetical protein
MAPSQSLGSMIFVTDIPICQLPCVDLIPSSPSSSCLIVRRYYLRPLHAEFS